MKADNLGNMNELSDARLILAVVLKVVVSLGKHVSVICGKATRRDDREGGHQGKQRRPRKFGRLFCIRDYIVTSIPGTFLPE